MTRKTTQQFIEDAIEIHGKKYNYDEVDYVNNRTKIIIVCPEHGKFKQTPGGHLASKGCLKCARRKRANSRRKTTPQFIADAIKVHGRKYNYSKVNYKGNNIKVTIICPKHGEFNQIPNSHLLNHGCPTCAIENSKGNYSRDKDTFIRDAQKVHGSIYGYSKVVYKGASTYVKIHCSLHGFLSKRLMLT